jgi:hypothetical protein
VPLPLALGLASALTCFDNQYGMHNRFGVMGAGWPEPAKSMGIDGEQYLRDPCRNIEAGCRFLAVLLQKNGGDIRSSLLAYLHQTPEYPFSAPTAEDLSCLGRIRDHVAMVSDHAFSRSWYTVVQQYDSPVRAEARARDIETLTGIRVFVVNRAFKYSVILAAPGEAERKTLMAAIKEATCYRAVESEEKRH